MECLLWGFWRKLIASYNHYYVDLFENIIMSQTWPESAQCLGHGADSILVLQHYSMLRRQVTDDKANFSMSFSQLFFNINMFSRQGMPIGSFEMWQLKRKCPGICSFQSNCSWQEHLCLLNTLGEKFMRVQVLKLLFIYIFTRVLIVWNFVDILVWAWANGWRNFQLWFILAKWSKCLALVWNWYIFSVVIIYTAVL